MHRKEGTVRGVMIVKSERKQQKTKPSPTHCSIPLIGRIFLVRKPICSKRPTEGTPHLISAFSNPRYETAP